MANDRFLPYLHHFRGLAIVLIVGVHCRTSLHWPADSWINKILTFGLDSSTILFVFVSGFLFQHLNTNQFNSNDYIIKKLKYVILPYVLVSIPAIVDKLFFEKNAVWMTSFYQDLPLPIQAVYLLATGKHSGPFYFIPMIAIVYCLSPLLFQLQKQKSFRWIGIGIPILGLFTYAYGYYGNILESLLYFLPVYIFGMWASKTKGPILHIGKEYLVGLVLIYVALLSFEVVGIIKPQHLQFFEKEPNYFTTTFNISKLKEMLLAIILLITFYRVRERKFPSLMLLGSYSFGIYFVHIYFINAVERLMDYIGLSRLQNGWGYLLFVCTIIGLSTSTVWLIKKVSKERSRLLIGS